MDKIDIDPFWYLADVLSLQNVAALIANYDPNEINHHSMVDDFYEKYHRLYPVEHALTNAVISNQLECEADVLDDDFDLYSQGIYDWNMMKDWRVKVDDVRKWLESRGIKTGFFFPQTDDIPDFLDPNHDNYAPKLAAAVRAWRAVNADPRLVVGKTVKKALMIWLRKNADQFGLTKDDGNPNEQGIEEIAKISNWAPKGGAPKTPG